MYIGRFAPSPTGPLHIGSLIAAFASYLEAKTRQGQWLLRMEDVDETRTVKGVDSLIVEALRCHGMLSDNEILVQSTRTLRYEEVLAQLKERSHVYACTCTRKEIADSHRATGIEGPIYPGTCRSNLSTPQKPHAWRIAVDNQNVTFDDAIQGQRSQCLSRDIGDFVIKRADGLFAYQLAVVVDDADQGVTHIVRGADLLDSTPRQLFLQSKLGFNNPHYMHLPVATHANGEKLSKQTLAEPLSLNRAVENLWQVLHFLHQAPPARLKHTDLSGIIEWAMTHWDSQKIPKLRSQIESHYA